MKLIVLPPSQYFIPFGIFIGGFALYLASSAPALAPYRDMGEMVAVSHTLGIAHPPGYPAYSLMGKISTLLPLANQSYRVNLLSVLGGTLSALFLYLALCKLQIQAVARLFAVFLWLSASGVWIVSIVTEMYSLNLAAGGLLLYLWTLIYSSQGTQFPIRIFILAAFLFGIFLGIRPDLVLLLPAFLCFTAYFLWKYGNRKFSIRTFIILFLFSVIGFSVFVYLPVRSKQKPYLNWNRPETIERLWGSLTRKTHGGTLDLLSTHYAPGELFWTDFKIYLSDAVKQFTWFGAFCAGAGIFALAKNNPFLLFFTVVGWIFAGPFFIYKANMPPNPHALAILEPYFLLPNIFLTVWTAFGLHFIIQFLSHYRMHFIFYFLLGTFALFHLLARWGEVSKRSNFFGLDYAQNIFRTLPPNSILAMQKDVQLFSFWALQYAEGTRPDVAVIARGLAGSPWYIQMRQEQGLSLKLGPLRSDSDFERFLNENPGRRFFAGWDQDVPHSEKYQQIPRGLVREITHPILSDTPLNRGAVAEPSVSPTLKPQRAEVSATGDFRFGQRGVDFFRDFYVYRGDYNSHRQKEFFSSNVIEDYSKAHFAKGIEESKSETRLHIARKEWNRAIALNSENGSFYYRRAFTFMQENKTEFARQDFLWAEKLMEKTYQQTQEYHSLPDVVKGVVSEWTDCLLNLGVVCEKLGKTEESERAYLKALKIEPRQPRAHYNLAVLYWNKDWQKVVHHLQEALRIDPNYEQAKLFLPKARYALQMSRR